MTKEEWLTAADPAPMFKLLHPTRRTYRRKFWLYGAACCRRIWPRITNPVSQRAVQAAEEFAEGRISRLDLEAISEEAHQVEGIDEDPVVTAAAHAVDYVGPDGWANSSSVGESVIEALPEAERAGELKWQSDLMRELLGPLPFRFVTIEPAWLTWNGGVVAQLAESIYSDNAFDRMPLVGDALQEAGCTNAEILNHCRQTAGHIRGCWVIDLLTKRPV